jgi:hypothetical protein
MALTVENNTMRKARLDALEPEEVFRRTSVEVDDSVHNLYAVVQNGSLYHHDANEDVDSVTVVDLTLWRLATMTCDEVVQVVGRMKSVIVS